MTEQQLTIAADHKVMHDARTLAFYDLTMSRSEEQRVLLWSRVQQSPKASKAASRRRAGRKQRSSDREAAAPTMELSVRLLYGGKPRPSERIQRMAVDCPADYTIAQTKQRIHEVTGIVVGKLRLRRREDAPVLLDEQTLAQSGIRDGASVIVDVCTVTVSVMLALPNNTLSRFTLYTDARATVGEWKQRIAAREDGYPARWQWADLVIRARIHSGDVNAVVCQIADTIDDDESISEYGAGERNVDDRADLLITRRQRPRAKQQYKQEKAERPDQLLRLFVCVAATNDVFEAIIMVGQPVIALKWQLVWMNADDCGSMRLSLCPSAASPSTVREYATASRLLSSADDFVSLQSLGVTNGRVLILDRSEKPFAVQLPDGVEEYYRPTPHSRDSCVLHADLDDTIAQLKAKLQTLVNMPAERMLFRFHRLLRVEVDDALTLRQLGLEGRGKMDKYVVDRNSKRYTDVEQLTARLLPHPASQPPTLEQQLANRLVQVGVRLLAGTGHVHTLWLLPDEQLGVVRDFALDVLKTGLKHVSPVCVWVKDNLALTVNGMMVDNSSSVSSVVRGKPKQLPIIDVIIRREGQAADGESELKSREEERSASDGNESTEPDDEKGEKSATQEKYHTSAKYVWLPTDFHIDHHGTARCLSYINNLHPVQHAAMYPLIERVVGRFVPLFERVLTSLRHPQQLKVPVGQWYDPADEERHNAEVEAKRAELGDEFDEDEAYQQWEDNKPLQQPLVPPFHPPTPSPTTVSLRGRRLQLIVKLADIVLTPEQPEYKGGVWHVEGMRNECIVASGIAYYDQSNIGPSSLAFRCAVTEPEYEQSDDRGVEAVYGLRNEEALVQPLGAVDTCNGRCIAFPNVYQHRVAPFSLLDPTQPGHRSILNLFLVDPTVTILSSSRVPPQQREWLVVSPKDSKVVDTASGLVPFTEPLDPAVDWPMSRNEAEQHRERLMQEQKRFTAESTAMFERKLSPQAHSDGQSEKRMEA